MKFFTVEFHSACKQAQVSPDLVSYLQYYYGFVASAVSASCKQTSAVSLWVNISLKCKVVVSLQPQFSNRFKFLSEVSLVSFFLL